MPITFTVFDQTLSEAVPVYVARLDAFLLALGPIGLQDVALSKRLHMGTIRYETTLQYTTPGPAQFRAACFEARADADVDALANAFFLANPSYRIHFVLDVSLERRRSVLQNSIMVLYVDSVIPNCGSDRSRPIVVEAVALIPPNATGPVVQVSASGVVGSPFNVVNRTNIWWPIGRHGYAAARMGTCVWDGYAGCCDDEPTFCCQWNFTAEYNCATSLWDVSVSSSTPDVLCTDDTDWVVAGDACVYTRTMYNPTPCSSEPDPAEPFGGAMPPDCCPETVWTNGAGTGLTPNVLNWNNGVNSSGIYVVMGGISNANASTGGPTNFPCRGIDFTGYTGQLTDGGGDLIVDAYGDVTLSAAIAKVHQRVNFYGNGAFDPGGYVGAAIYCFGTNKRVSIVASCTLQSIAVGGGAVDPTINIGSNVISITENGIDWQSANNWLYSGAGHVRLADASQPYISSDLAAGHGRIAPLVLELGCGGFQVYYTYLVSILQHDGEVKTGGGPLDVSGNWVGDGGEITNVTGTVAGNVSLANMTLSGGTLAVAGTNAAANCVITNWNASGGTTLIATGCVNGGGNTNVTFI